jgi:hypothetical protein
MGLSLDKQDGAHDQQKCIARSGQMPLPKLRNSIWVSVHHDNNYEEYTFVGVKYCGVCLTVHVICIVINMRL